MTHSRTHRLTLSLAAAVLVAPLIALPAHATDAPDRDVDSVERSSAAVELTPVSAGESAARVVSPAPDLSAAAAGDVSGRVLVVALGGGSPQPAGSGEATVRFWLELAGTYYLEAQTSIFDGDGDFTVSNLPAGTYRVEVLANIDGVPGKAYYIDEQYWANADAIAFNEGAATLLGTITVTGFTPYPGRIAGDDRYSTAVELTRSTTIDGGADVVYLVSGAGYADALSAGPAAAVEGGVLLLTRPNELPSIVAEELQRLDPSRVVIVGGTSAVASRVATQVGNAVDAEVVRIAGADRYATSRAVVDYAWPDGVEWVATATGRNFPDALAASAAIATRGGAVVLVDGSRSTLDSATRNFLISKDPTVVAIAGGPASVSNGIASGINGLPGNPEVERLGGDDRYETARIINAQFFSGLAPDFAFIATGRGFADALAGGPVAAALGAPIYLSEQRCLDADTYFDILDLFVREMYAIGGTAVLSNRVLTGTLC